MTALFFACLLVAQPHPERLDDVRVGMTADRVREILGPPERVGRQVTQFRTLEHWAYPGRARLRLVFEARRGIKPTLVIIDAPHRGPR